MVPVFVLFMYLSAGAAATAEPPSDLSPGAQIHNRQGIAHIEAGAHAAGVEELERAYLLMPDPIQYRAGRSKVLGSMRSALNQLYQSTGDPAHLHRLQRHLLRHLEALLVALGDSATAQDTAGSLAALREVEETLARRPAGPPPVTAPAAVPPARVEPPRPSPARAAPDAAPSPVAQRRATPTSLRHAGGALMGVGLAGLGIMTYALVVHADSRNKLQDLTRLVMESGARPSDRQEDRFEDLFRRGHTGRTLGVVSGVVGGVAVVTGLALHLVGRRHPATARVAPALAPGSVRLDLHLRF